MGKLRIGVIAGDGIGNETVPEGIRVLEAAGRRFGIEYEWTSYDWSCERYAKTGRMMPEDGIEQLKAHDSIFLGAVGWPVRVAALMAAELGVEAHRMQKVLEAHVRSHLADLAEVQPEFR